MFELQLQTWACSHSDWHSKSVKYWIVVTMCVDVCWIYLVLTFVVWLHDHHSTLCASRCTNTPHTQIPVPVEQQKKNNGSLLKRIKKKKPSQTNQQFDKRQQKTNQLSIRSCLQRLLQSNFDMAADLKIKSVIGFNGEYFLTEHQNLCNSKFYFR